MATLTQAQRELKEAEVRRLLDDGLLVSEVARKLKVRRQSVWEFCARRGWLPDEDQVGYSKTVREKDERKTRLRKQAP